MAYNRKNFLLRVKEINEVYKEYASKGWFNEYIFNNYIRDRFHISRATFYNYLAIPYSRLLLDVERMEQRRKKMEPTLF